MFRHKELLITHFGQNMIFAWTLSNNFTTIFHLHNKILKRLKSTLTSQRQQLCIGLSVWSIWCKHRSYAISPACMSPEVFVFFSILQLSLLIISHDLYHHKGVPIPKILRYYMTLFGEHSKIFKMFCLILEWRNIAKIKNCHKVFVVGSCHVL